jgi:hypothetical protein
MADDGASQRPPVPPCVTCHERDNVVVCDTPEFPHIHYYCCTKCGHYWAANLAGKIILINSRIDPT